MKLLAAALLLLALPLRAQDVAITANVDRSQVALNEQIVLQVAIGGPVNLPEPALPSLPNFQVYNSGTSQNIVMTNGQVQSQMTYTYVLVPRYPGNFQIPPIQLSAGGKIYATQPIAVTVRPAGAAPQANPPQSQPRPAPQRRRANPDAPDVLASARIDKTQAYVGEQLNLTVRFQYGVPLLGNAEYNAPNAQGFLSEDLPPPRTMQLQEHGRRYYATEVKSALFPVEAGTAVVGPAAVKCQVRQDVDIDPMAPEFFQRFFSGSMSAGVQRELKTDPIKIKVLPLPSAGKPEGFSGAVGRYKIGRTVNKTELKVGEAVDLVVRVEGDGNLKAAGPPVMPELESFQVYDTVSSLSTTKKDDVVRSSKEFKTILVPKVSGRLKVGPVKFSYFDPQSAKYVTLATEPMEFKVKPGEAPAQPLASSPGPSSAPGVVAVASDIRYLKLERRPGGLAAFERAWAGAAWPHGLPLAAFLFCAGLGTWRRREELDPRAYRRRRALSKARRKLQSAQSGKTEGRPAVQLAAEALEGYLVDKLGPEAAGLPFKKTVEMLAARHAKVPPENIAALKALWEQMEGLRFAPGGENGGDGAQLAKDAARQLEALEKTL